MTSVETVVFNGITFRRYPDAKRVSDRVYYRPGIADKQRGVQNLHQEVWKATHGPIPDGYEIHHRDHDPLNNAIENLELLSKEEHRAHHHADPDHFWGRTVAGKAHLDEIRPLAAAWHSTPEGIEWHRQHGREAAANRPTQAGVCEQCGNAFLSKHPERFCSNRCKSAWRRASGLDDVTRACAWCGADFTTNRYSKVRFCSKAHAGKARRANT